jgi:hypothetical protein
LSSSAFIRRFDSNRQLPEPQRSQNSNDQCQRNDAAQTKTAFVSRLDSQCQDETGPKRPVLSMLAPKLLLGNWQSAAANRNQAIAHQQAL